MLNVVGDFFWCFKLENLLFLWKTTIPKSTNGGNFLYAEQISIVIFSDPPLESQDIPKGEWLCHSCKYTKEQPSTPALRHKRSNSTPISVNTCSSANSKTTTKKAKTLNPMDVLIEAANSMNPKQFELPRSMSVPCLFPGTDKGEMEYFTG